MHSGFLIIIPRFPTTSSLNLILDDLVKEVRLCLNKSIRKRGYRNVAILKLYNDILVELD